MSNLIARGLGLVEIVDDVTGPRVLNAFRKLSNKPENEQEKTDSKQNRGPASLRLYLMAISSYKAQIHSCGKIKMDHFRNQEKHTFAL